MDDDRFFNEHALDEVWLHPVHFAASAGMSAADPIVPLFACNHPGPSQQPWDQKMKSIALLTIQGEGLRADDSDDELLSMERAGTRCQVVLLLDTELQVMTDDEFEGVVYSRIPLNFSDIVWAAVPGSENCNNRQKFVVVLSPRPEETDDGNSQAASLRKIWVLCVGHSYTQEGLQELLFRFSSRGAVRWDLDQCYRITQRSLGEGGCGMVFLGQSIAKVGAAQVALKLVKTSRSPEDDEKSIRREISILAEVGGHPNICMLFGVFCYLEDKKQTSQTEMSQNSSSSASSIDALAYSEEASVVPAVEQLRWAFVMELCPLGDLFDFLSSNGSLDTAATLVLALSVFSALSYIHAHEVVHRDIKAENILIANGFRPVLADFGIAAHLGDRKAMVKQVGSPGYVAPEVVDGKRYGSKVDIFGAGVMIYFATSDRMPFPGSDKYEVLARTIRCKVRFPLRVLETHSSSLLELIKKLLSKEPMQRPSATFAFRAAWTMASKDSQDLPTVRAAAEAMERLKHIVAKPKAATKQRLKPDAKRKAQAAKTPKCESIQAPPAASNAQDCVSPPEPGSCTVSTSAANKNFDGPSEAMNQLEPDAATQNALPERSSQLQDTEAASLSRNSASFSSAAPRSSASLPSPMECGSSSSPVHSIGCPVISPSSSGSFSLPALPAAAAPPVPPQLPMPVIQDLVLEDPPDRDESREECLGIHECKADRHQESLTRKSLVPRPPESATRRLSSRVSRVGRRLLQPIERALQLTNGASSHLAKQLQKKQSAMGEADAEHGALDPQPTLLNSRRCSEQGKALSPATTK
eukprot:TRINITY_DN17815_c0_g1_i1.p1 TRINITY_DN17815_c0_g1~~TRINITY_DN17815_c0_g1_i1.p1  ORF type:complete len:810 (+),score=152.49 TRINITY_DN17815_c0_g1_i1:74-2503(+)